MYENKLRKLLQSDGQGVVNGAEQGVLYSDSEDEAETLEQDVEESGMTSCDFLFLLLLLANIVTAFFFTLKKKEDTNLFTLMINLVCCFTLITT